MKKLKRRDSHSDFEISCKGLKIASIEHHNIILLKKYYIE